MRAIIVEDSRLARVELKEQLKTVKQIELVAETGDPDIGIELINSLKPDVIFLDIQMPGKNGFELLDALSFNPQVIFTTAYDQYAIRSFEYDAVDYLLKPIETERLKTAIDKLSMSKEENDVEALALEANSSVFVKDGEKCWLVELNNIHLIESCGNYCQVYFDGHKPLIHKSLNQLEQRLPGDLFFRANRQQIINLKAIKGVELEVNNNLIIMLKTEQKVEISRRHTSRFKQLLSL